MRFTVTGNIDVPSGSYEAQVRAHRGESASAWWPVPPSKTYVK